MTDLAQDFRSRLGEVARISVRKSSRNNHRTTYAQMDAAHDECRIETVYIPEPIAALGISSQVAAR